MLAVLSPSNQAGEKPPTMFRVLAIASASQRKIYDRYFQARAATADSRDENLKARIPAAAGESKEERKRERLRRTKFIRTIELAGIFAVSRLEGRFHFVLPVKAGHFMSEQVTAPRAILRSSHLVSMRRNDFINPERRTVCVPKSENEHCARARIRGGTDGNANCQATGKIADFSVLN